MLRRFVVPVFVCCSALLLIVSGVVSAQPTGPSTTVAPYLDSHLPNVSIQSILTVGDGTIPKSGGGDTRFVGIPDGLGVIDGADLGEGCQIPCAILRSVGEAAFEIDADRRIARRDDPRSDPHEKVKRNVLTVCIPVSIGERGAARCNRLCAGADNSLGAAGVPNIVQDQRSAFDMQISKSLGFLGSRHVRRPWP